jgi:uncharacterized membrane protein
MIQRIQSIFLMLAGVTMSALFKVPFAISDKPIPHMMNDQVYNIQDSTILIILTATAALLAIGAIFLYTNRDLQVRIGYIVIVCSVLLLLVTALLFYNERTLNTQQANIEDQIGLYLPLVSILFASLAIRSIRKDENLVRSMDRLR